MQTTYQIAEQIGQRGYYAQVTIDCLLLKESKLIICKNEQVEKWQNAISFACDYFYHHLKMDQGLQVNIIEIDDNPVDTSPIIVVFVLIKAIEKHLKLNTASLVEFDKTSGKFVFAK